MSETDYTTCESNIEEECCNCWEFADDGCMCDCHSVDEESDKEEETEIYCKECSVKKKT